MLSKVLAFPFILGACVFLYLAWEQDTSWGMYIVPNVIALAVIYVLSPQIDWWWYKRHTPELDPHLRYLFTQRHQFYKGLSEPMKKRFRDRLFLYMQANEFMPQVMESVPLDIKGMVAANVVHLTFGRKDFRLSKYEHIILYPRPFPSPQYPKNFHASEIFDEDGVIMFAIEQLMHSTFNPIKNFNIGLYEYARIFMRMYPNNNYPTFDENSWEILEQISGFSKEYIQRFINLEDIDPVAVSISHFLVFPQKFQQLLPGAYNTYQQIFNLNPLNPAEPVVDKTVLS